MMPSRFWKAALRRALDAPFAIGRADEIIVFTRVSVAVILLIWCFAGPFTDFYSEQEMLLYRPQGVARLIPPLGYNGYMLAWWATAIGSFGMLVPRTARMATFVTAFAFFVLNGYVSGFGSLWNYNTHLNTFLIALCFTVSGGQADRGRRDDRNSSIVFFMRAQIALIYLQAGLAKVIHGGFFWGSSAPYFHLILLDGYGAALLGDYPAIVSVFGYLVVITELTIAPMFLLKRAQPAAVVVAFLLHCSFFVLLGISFWPLWATFPALFLSSRAPTSTVKGATASYLFRASRAHS